MSCRCEAARRSVRWVVCKSACLSVCTSVCASVCLPVGLSICLCVRWSEHRNILRPSLVCVRSSSRRRSPVGFVWISSNVQSVVRHRRGPCENPSFCFLPSSRNQCLVNQRQSFDSRKLLQDVSSTNSVFGTFCESNSRAALRTNLQFSSPLFGRWP